VRNNHYIYSMKAKLIKTDVNYLLEDNKGVVIGSTSTKEINKLSKQNCDEIFGVGMDIGKICIECLAEDYSKLTVFFMPDSDEVPTAKQILEYEKISEIAYKAGLIKGLKLNKDKVFTLEDMMNCWNKALKFQDHKETLGEYIQSIQQPTEIEVEIETTMRPVWGDESSMRATYVTKLDSEGCLILKKI